MRSPVFWIAAFARTITSLVLIAAATAKLLSARVEPEGLRSGILGFAQELSAQAVLPHPATLPAAVTILGAELGLAILGLSHRAVRFWACASLTLLAGFSAYLLLLAAKGTSPTCPCFGVFGGGALVGALIRNASLSALASLSLLASAQPPIRRPA